MTRCDECGAVMGFCLCAVRKREAVERVARNEWAFYAAHDGHDVGWRHEDGRLYSATCHATVLNIVKPKQRKQT